MNIALLQLNILWESPLRNIRHAEQLMSAQPDADLYVLPEMWATGFMTKPNNVVEDEEHNLALEWMKRQARVHSCAISGSLAVKVSEGDYRNRHYFVTPDEVFFYDKHHLFTHGHENDAYVAGSQHVVVEWKGCRFLLLTCYDLRFPVWSRYGIAGEYDAIIYVANWPASRQYAWNVLTCARAIENQCYVIAINRVGTDAKTQYSGGSALIDTLGRYVIVDETHTEQTLTGRLNMDSLNEARKRFKVLADRDMCQ